MNVKDSLKVEKNLNVLGKTKVEGEVVFKGQTKIKDKLITTDVVKFKGLADATLENGELRFVTIKPNGRIKDGILIPSDFATRLENAARIPEIELNFKEALDNIKLAIDAIPTPKNYCDVFNPETQSYYYWVANETTNTVFAPCPENLKVGIGTAEPQAKLHVNGSSYINKNLKVGENAVWIGTTETGEENSIWTTNGSLNLQPESGFVGVGTSSPELPLHVNGGASFKNVGIGTSNPLTSLHIVSSNPNFRIENASNNFWNIALSDENVLHFHDNSFNNILSISAEGVGISESSFGVGETDAVSRLKLDIGGDVRIGYGDAAHDIRMGWNGASHFMNIRGGSMVFSFAPDGNEPFYRAHSRLVIKDGDINITNGRLHFGGGSPQQQNTWDAAICTEKGSAWVTSNTNDDGQYMGIGMTGSGFYFGLSPNPISHETETDIKYPFYVTNDGLTVVREVLVTHNGWPDVVFDDSYVLKPLSEVAAYIKEHKHLPDVPSEEEVLKNGTELGRMDEILLQKIEELTLYVIDLKKENEVLNKQINAIIEK